MGSELYKKTQTQIPLTPCSRTRNYLPLEKEIDTAASPSVIGNGGEGSSPAIDDALLTGVGVFSKNRQQLDNLGGAITSLSLYSKIYVYVSACMYIFVMV